MGTDYLRNALANSRFSTSEANFGYPTFHEKTSKAKDLFIGENVFAEGPGEYEQMLAPQDMDLGDSSIPSLGMQ